VIRFCLRVHHAGYSYPDLQRLVCIAEVLGYDGASLYDVFNPRALEVWSALSALTGATQHIILMPLVLDVGYRHPALLAKMAAGLDQIGGGQRLIVGLGYGGNPSDHTAYGFGWQPSVKSRVATLEEHAQILRGLWREQRFSFDGQAIQLVDAPGLPPATAGGPPLLIASRGKQFGLGGVARQADLCNISFDLSPAEWLEYQTVLQAHLARAARPSDSVGLTHNATVVIRHRRDDAERAFDEFATSRRLTSEQARHGLEHALVGTPDDVVDRLRAFASAGVDLKWVFLLFPDLPSTDSVQLFAERVIPALR